MKLKNNNLLALSIVAQLIATSALSTSAIAVETSPVTQHIDIIKITVDSTCTLGTISSDGAYNDNSLKTTDATTHASGEYDDPKTSEKETLGEWTIGTPVGGVRTDTLALTMQPGTKSENIGSTTFTVRCNNASGYSLSALAPNKDLTKDGSSAVIPGAATSNTDSFWNFRLSDATLNGMTIVEAYKTAGPVPTSSTVIASKNSAGNVADGESVTVTYGAGISKSQESGTYTGSVTYTLAQLDSGGGDTDKSPKSPKNEPESKKTPVEEKTPEQIIPEPEPEHEQESTPEPTQEPEETPTNVTPTEETPTEEPEIYEEPANDSLSFVHSASPYSVASPSPTTVGTTSNTADATTTKKSTDTDNASPKGVISTSGSATKGVESSDNTGIVVALVAAGVAAAAATGAFLYTKNKEEE